MAKSRTQDKTQGALERAKGRFREAAGALTGDASQKRKGRAEQAKGTARTKRGHLKDLFK
jgi:uncharacterized protein YjbJ (UPF0337 family)